MTSSKSRRRNGGTTPGNDQPKSAPVAAPQMLPEAPRSAAYQGQERIGDTLRRVREQRGEMMEAIADYLRIKPLYLDALEGSRYDDLPADAYVIGFLRTYANYLGLDGRNAIDRYRKEMAGRRNKPQLAMPQPLSEGQAPSPQVIIGALLAALFIYLLWASLSSPDRAVNSTPPLSAAEEAAPEKAAAPDLMTNGTLPTVGGTGIPVPAAPETIAPAPQPAPAAPAAAPVSAPEAAATTVDPQLLTVRATKDSWLLITDEKGSTVYDHVLKTDETYIVPSQRGLRLTTGNAAGLILALGGKDLDLFEKNAHVVRNMPIDVEKWQKAAISGVKTPLIP